MKARDVLLGAVVGAGVAVVGVKVATKKYMDSHGFHDVAQKMAADGKRFAEDSKDLGRVVAASAKEAADKAKAHGERFVSEAKEKINEAVAKKSSDMSEVDEDAFEDDLDDFDEGAEAEKEYDFNYDYDDEESEEATVEDGDSSEDAGEEVTADDLGLND